MYWNKCFLNHLRTGICAMKGIILAGGFICNLVLGICDFRHKTPRQGHYLSDSSNTGQAWHRELGFSKLNKKTYGAICI